MKIFLSYLISAVLFVLFQCPQIYGQTNPVSRLDVQIITDEADAVLSILAKTESNLEITESDWQRVFSSEGYVRLKKREHSLSRPFEDSTFRSFVLSDEVVKKRKGYAETLARWKDANVIEIAARSFAYLPQSSQIRAKIYPVIKPKPNNFVFEYPDNPAIFLYLDPAASKAKFEAILAHELHHIGYGSGCSTKEEQAEINKLPPETRKVLTWLGSFGEGFASLAAAGSPDINPYTNLFLEESANWNKDIADFNTHFKTVEKFFLDLSDGKLSEKQINETGFSFFGVPGRSGLWYVVGWQIGVVIEKIYGREKLVEVICNRRKLLSTYNKAVKKYNRRNNTQLAQGSNALIMSVSASGSQIRRQAAFEPFELVSFPTQDGGLIYANLYGTGSRGVVLAHGGRFNKDSWEKQAKVLVKAGFRVLAIDFRGRGQSRGSPSMQASVDDGSRYDVLAAIRFLRKGGAKTVSVIGASFGGGAAAEASIKTKPGEIDCLILLAHAPIDSPEQMRGRKLFILSRDDVSGENKISRLPKIREQYESASEPKELLLLDGSAHAQFIFETDQGERLMREILRFLSKP